MCTLRRTQYIAYRSRWSSGLVVQDVSRHNTMYARHVEFSSVISCCCCCCYSSSSLPQFTTASPRRDAAVSTYSASDDTQQQQQQSLVLDHINHSRQSIYDHTTTQRCVRSDVTTTTYCDFSNSHSSSASAHLTDDNLTSPTAAAELSPHSRYAQTTPGYYLEGCE